MLLSGASQVFICLQDGGVERKQFIGPRPVAPPYGVDPDAVLQHYLRIGAESVHLHTVKTAELDYSRHRMEQALNVRKYVKGGWRAQSRNDR